MILGAIFLAVKFTFEWIATIMEHLVPGFGFVVRPEWGAAGSARADVHVLLFLYDRLARHAHDRGLGILPCWLFMAHEDKFTPDYYAPLEITGLYWHFVDIVWIFLFPLLYLIGGRYLTTEGH